MSEGKKRVNRAQRYTDGMLDAVNKLAELVRVGGLSVLPPRAVEVIGDRPPTKANLIEAAVRVLLDEADGRALGAEISKGAKSAESMLGAAISGAVNTGMSPDANGYVYGVIAEVSDDKMTLIVRPDGGGVMLRFHVTTYHSIFAPKAGVRVRVMVSKEGRFLWAEPTPSESSVAKDIAETIEEVTRQKLQPSTPLPQRIPNPSIPWRGPDRHPSMGRAVAIYGAPGLPPEDDAWGANENQPAITTGSLDSVELTGEGATAATATVDKKDGER